MASYGRNFDFRTPPVGAQRQARWLLGGTTNVPIGAPVKYSSGTSASSFAANGVHACLLATGNQNFAEATTGIAVYEHAPAAFAGVDPFLTTYSDIDYVPFGKLFQLVSGKGIKVAFKNTQTRTFLGTHNYVGRTMVTGIGGSTTGLVVGDLLTPGSGNDDAGYWQETATASEAWLVVTDVQLPRLTVEARMNF